MAEQKFDRLLKEALMQAMEEDLRALPQEDIPISEEQRLWMERLLADPAFGRKEAKRRGLFRRSALRFTAVAAAVVLLAGSAIAYTVGGGEFFRDMFLRRSEEMPAYAAVMNAEQLLELGSESVGTVVMSEEFRLEVVDAVCSGNSAMAAIRITALQLEEFAQDEENWKNYCFLEMSDSISASREGFSASWSYVFSDQDESLAPNECFLILRLTSREMIGRDTYTIALEDFGYIQRGQEDTVLYPGKWEVQVTLDGSVGHSRSVELNAPITLDGFAYTLTHAVVTPLTLTMEFTSESDDFNCPDVLFTAVREMELKLQDGSLLGAGDFYTSCSAAGTGEMWKMTVGVEFPVPLPAGAVQCLSLGGTDTGMSFD